MVEELAGLFHSWKRAVIADELATATGSSDLTARHDRWMWPLLQRAKGGHYRTINCKDRHVPERVAPKPTDRQHVPADRRRASNREDGANRLLLDKTCQPSRGSDREPTD